MTAIKRIAFSVPARELLGISLPGSIFDPALLLQNAISFELRAAILAVMQGTAANVPVKFVAVARPEIFTHGVTLQWLMDELVGVEDHVSFSDGTTIKLIPGMANHIFLYGLSSQRRNVEFYKVLSRAPELFPRLSTQINSHHHFRIDGVDVAPKSRTLLLDAPIVDESPTWSFPFYMNHHSLEDSAERAFALGAMDTIPGEGYEDITYIPLTDAAMHDANFQRVVTTAIRSAYLDRSTCLILGLPAMESPSAPVTDRMISALSGIRASGTLLPRASATNIFFITHVNEVDLKPLAPRMTMVLHETFCHWMYTVDFYSALKGGDYYLREDRYAHPAEFESTLVAGIGKRFQIRTSKRPQFDITTISCADG